MEYSKIALLIDADNISGSQIEAILNETNRYGRITVKRMYSDWTTDKNKKWKENINSHAIRPIQQFSYTNGKNSSDSALIIDAMDLLHSKTIDAFCIVSSDSDYTGLAHRIREEGLGIIGIGEEKTPISFRKACISFVDLNNVSSSDNKSKNKPVKPKKEIDYSLIEKAFNNVVKDDGLALLSKLSEMLKKIDSEFDFRAFGYKNFTSFCRALKGYEVHIHNDKRIDKHPIHRAC